MPQERDPVLFRLSDEADQNGTVDLLTPPLKRLEVWEAEEISVQCEDANQGYALVGIFDGNRPAWFYQQALGNDDFWYNVDLRLTMLTDYQVIVRFTGVGVNARCDVNVNGYVLEPFTSP